MAVIINEIEIVTPQEAEPPAEASVPLGTPRPNEPRPLDVKDLVDLDRWAQERARRRRAH